MAKTKAEIQKAWRDKKKTKPLLEQLGYPEFSEYFEQEAKDLQKALDNTAAWAERLNKRMMEAIEQQPDEPRRAKALAELQRFRNIKIKTF